MFPVPEGESGGGDDDGDDEAAAAAAVPTRENPMPGASARGL